MQSLLNYRIGVEPMAESPGKRLQGGGAGSSSRRLVVGLLLATLVTGGCTALVVGGAGQRSSYPEARSEAAIAADQQTGEAVRQALAADPRLRNAAIEVTARDGIVTLEGLVADYETRSQAELLTAGVSGVLGIHNRLQLGKRQ